jgi:hypothetical protein
LDDSLVSNEAVDALVTQLRKHNTVYLLTIVPEDAPDRILFHSGISSITRVQQATHAFFKQIGTVYDASLAQQGEERGILKKAKTALNKDIRRVKPPVAKETSLNVLMIGMQRIKERIARFME